MSTVLEALDALGEKATPGPWKMGAIYCLMDATGRHVAHLDEDDGHEDKEVRARANGPLTVLAVNHLRGFVEALGGTERRLRAAAEHFMRTDPHYADVMRAWASEAEKALAALQRDIEEA